jgi:UDP-N-acetyl-D-galactosamine dehydrogenase
MNEIAQIFSKMDLSVWDVLAAARTKWNFLPFAPGLVGGHCIGVDPYYLSHRAEELGVDARVILSGRGINDRMAGWVGQQLHAARGDKPGSVLMLGLTFKENIPDLRNSKVADLVCTLGRLGHAVTVHDAHADSAEALHEYGIPLVVDAFDRKYDMVVLAVPHREYLALGGEALRGLLNDGGTLADLKGELGSAADWTL